MNTIREIQINELLKFINSKEFKEFNNHPISYHRAVSYANNHRANDQDPAVTLLYHNKQLIAYRCLYSDYFFVKDKKIDFAWISGSWVHPDFRRQGYSMMLLKHCLQIKKDRIMFSNYAPDSKSLYDKSGQFTEVSDLKGKRFYFRFSFEELLAPKHSFFKKIKPLLYITDLILNVIFDVRFLFFRCNTKNINYDETDNICKKTHHFVEHHTGINPFKRNSKEINHAQNYPWVIELKSKEKEEVKYIFSSTAKVFKYKNITIFDEENNISAYVLLKIKNKSMTIPYTFFQKKELHNLVKIILKYVKIYKIKYLTLFNTLIIKELLNQKSLILFSKKMHRKFFATNNLANLLEKPSVFYDGDGDNLYT